MKPLHKRPVEARLLPLVCFGSKLKRYYCLEFICGNISGSIGTATYTLPKMTLHSSLDCCICTRLNIRLSHPHLKCVRSEALWPCRAACFCVVPIEVTSLLVLRQACRLATARAAHFRVHPFQHAKRVREGIQTGRAPCPLAVNCLVTSGCLLGKVLWGPPGCLTVCRPNPKH